MEKLPRTGEEREKEGKGGRKGRFEGVKCAKELSKESFSGKSNPESFGRVYGQKGAFLEVV